MGHWPARLCFGVGETGESWEGRMKKELYRDQKIR